MNTHPFFKYFWTNTFFTLFLSFFIPVQGIGQVDVALQLETDMTTSSIGENIIFTLTAHNIRATDVGNLTIKMDVPNSLDYVNSNPSTGTSFSFATKEWVIGNQLDANQTIHF